MYNKLSDKNKINGVLQSIDMAYLIHIMQIYTNMQKLIKYFIK